MIIRNRVIPSDVEVLAGTDLPDAWNRFEVFEALHHGMKICNPMSSDELDALVGAIEPGPGTRILDAACGYGELLIRCAERAGIDGVGVDLSPWMIRTASDSAASRLRPDAHLRWVLGEARDYSPRALVDVAVCIGAEWVWHDFAGTVRALDQRVRDGGVIVVGAARLHLNADQDEVRETHGVVESVSDMAEMLRSRGYQVEYRIDPDDAGWDAYLGRTQVCAQAWATNNPGSRADQWLQEQADWHAAREHDRDIIGWSVWVARKTGSSA